MKAISIEHLRQLINRLAERDVELHQEIRKVAPESQEALNEYVRLWGVPEPAELEDDSGRPTSVGCAVLETIVQPARPVMLIQNNKVTPQFLGPDSQVWATRVGREGKKNGTRL